MGKWRQWFFRGAPGSGPGLSQTIGHAARGIMRRLQQLGCGSRIIKSILAQARQEQHPIRFDFPRHPATRTAIRSSKVPSKIRSTTRIPSLSYSSASASRMMAWE